MRELLEQKESYTQRIEAFVHQYVYNLGHSGEIGAKAIIDGLRNRKK